MDLDPSADPDQLTKLCHAPATCEVMTMSVTHQTLDGVDVKGVLHLNEESD